MLKMTRVAIAKILNNRYKIRWPDDSYNTGYKKSIEDVASEIADYIAINNPYFSKIEFMNECGIID